MIHKYFLYACMIFSLLSIQSISAGNVVNFFTQTLCNKWTSPIIAATTGGSGLAVLCFTYGSYQGHKDAFTISMSKTKKYSFVKNFLIKNKMLAGITAGLLSISMVSWYATYKKWTL